MSSIFQQKITFYTYDPNDLISVMQVFFMFHVKLQIIWHVSNEPETHLRLNSDKPSSFTCPQQA